MDSGGFNGWGCTEATGSLCLLWVPLLSALIIGFFARAAGFNTSVSSFYQCHCHCRSLCVSRTSSYRSQTALLFAFVLPPLASRAIPYLLSFSRTHTYAHIHIRSHDAHQPVSKLGTERAHTLSLCVLLFEL